MPSRPATSSTVNGPCVRGVARHQIVERLLDRIGERGRQAGWQRDAERVAHARGILGGREAGAGRDHPPLTDQLVQPRLRIFRRAGAELVEVERAEVGEQVAEIVGVARMPGRYEPLQLELQLGEHFGIEELPELFGTEQVAQQVAVERERGGAPLRERRVAFVHVDRDPAEQQRLRERRRPLGLDGNDAELARTDVAEHLAQRGEVEHVPQALTRRFEQHREGRIAGRDLEQIGRALALLPQRGALARAAAREEQRTGRVLPEPRREQRRARQALDDELFDFVRLEQQQVERDVLDAPRAGAG